MVPMNGLLSGFQTKQTQDTARKQKHPTASRNGMNVVQSSWNLPRTPQNNLEQACHQEEEGSLHFVILRTTHWRTQLKNKNNCYGY
jgi:hypothetical protein